MRQQLPVRSPLGSKAIRSGLWAASGTAAASIAREMVSLALRERFGVDRVVLTDSGTSALTLAIRGLDSSGGRPVAIPAYGCFDLATAVLGAGASFVLYDSDPATLGPDLDSLAKALSMGADRVVVAHLYGVPVDLLAVRALADSFGAAIIDDAAQGAGASLDGMPLGSFGAAGVLSFGRGKGVTGGSGGALLLPADVAAAADPALRLKPGDRGSASEFVKLVAQWVLGRPLLYGIPSALPFLGLGETKFRAPHHPSGPSALSLGVLLESLRLVDQDATVRREHANRHAEATRGRDLSVPRIVRGAVSGFLRYPVVASLAKARSAALPVARRLGIMPGYPRALCDLVGFGDERLNLRDDFPGARLLAARLITLPTHAFLDARDLRNVAAWCAQ